MEAAIPSSDGRSISPWLFDISQRLTVASLVPVKRLIAEWLGDAPRDSVLDLCCGTGSFSELAPAEYLGVDLDESAIGVARERSASNPRKRYLVHDVATLEVPPGSFDLVIFANGLHHMPDEIALGTLRVAARSTKGPIVIVDPALETRALPSRVLFALERGGFLRKVEAQRALLDRAGLVISREQALYSRFAHQRIFLCRPA